MQEIIIEKAPKPAAATIEPVKPRLRKPISGKDQQIIGHWTM